MDKKNFYLVAIVLFLIFVFVPTPARAASNAINAREEDARVEARETGSSQRIERRRIGRRGEVISDKEEREIELEKKKKQISSGSDTAAGAPSLPDSWLYQRIKVDNTSKKSYDNDNDGWLSPYETKQMLKDKYERINTSGQAPVDEEIERQYDTNRDGIIDADEAKAMASDLQ